MWLGDFPEDFTTVVCMFTTHSSTGAPVAPLSGFENADVIIYKNGSATQKTSQNGVTMTSPFDSITGLHCLTIDTSNDTGDAAFWTAGSLYTLVLSPDTETVDSVAVAKVLGQFGIELYGGLKPGTLVEAGLTVKNAMRLSAAADAGKLSGAATSTNTIRNAVADSKDRIVATVDTDGNRTAITYDLTD